MKITEHFSVEEFAQHARHGFDREPYPERWLQDWIQDRLRALCAVLEVIRAQVGRPITILSGYRSAAYNRRIGGAARSQHVQGRAADIVVAGEPRWTAWALHDLVSRMHAEGDIQIGGLGLYPTFVHVDVRPGSRLARWTGSRTDS